MKSRVDIVIPCYNEKDCVGLIYEKIDEVLREKEDLEWAVIFVNDGSTDSTLYMIKRLEKEHGSQRIKYISFSRNFGKESAIFAGLSYAKADYVVLMDADLQHPPEIIPIMLKHIEEGYDVCGARRVSRRGEPPVRSFFSKCYYHIINKLTGLKFVQGGSDFRMMKRSVVDAILSMEERERFTKGILSWVGFDVKWIEYENVKRAAGKTKWSFGSLFKYAMSGFFAFATTPLRIAVWIGFFIDLITLIVAIWFAVSILRSDGPRTGYGTIVILIAFFGGTIMLLLGIVGEYLARIYLEVKKRPIYLVKESNIDPF